MPDTIRYGFIHSTLCPLFTLSIRVLHSNAGHIQKKVTCYVPLSISTGTYRQKIIYDVPLVLSCGTYKTIFSIYVLQPLLIALILPDR